MRVLILGGDADGNLGDRAILVAMCDELRSLVPDVRITVVSQDPARASTWYRARPIQAGPAGFAAFCVAARKADLILCGGGGLFQDDDSLVKVPYWLARLSVARLLCRRVAGFSLGVGPLAHRSSRWSARRAFSLMADVSVRDPLACRTASALAGQSVDVIPDPAFMLHPVAPEAARKWLTDRGVPLDGSPLVGVAARRVFPARPRIVPHKIRWRLGSRRMSAATEELVARLAGDLDRIAERRRAYVLLMPSYSAAHEQDVEVSEAIVQRMASSRAQVARVDDPRLYKGITGQLSLMLGGRMHPTILAAAMGTRVVGIGYNQKFQGAFQLLGQSHRVVDIQTVTAQRHPGLGELLEAALDDDPPDPSRARELADRTRNRLADLVAGRGG